MHRSRTPSPLLLLLSGGGDERWGYTRAPCAPCAGFATIRTKTCDRSRALPRRPRRRPGHSGPCGIVHRHNVRRTQLQTGSHRASTDEGSEAAQRTLCLDPSATLRGPSVTSSGLRDAGDSMSRRPTFTLSFLCLPNVPRHRGASKGSRRRRRGSRLRSQGRCRRSSPRPSCTRGPQRCRR
jgi:hypothetical protein